MRYSLQRLTEPDSEPVTVAEAKVSMGEFLSVTDRDADILELITAAREWVEGLTGRILIEQTWRLRVGTDRWVPTGGPKTSAGSLELGAGGELWLRRSPVIALVAASNITAAGVETTIDIDADAGFVALRDGGTRWPSLVRVDGVAWPTSDNAITQIDFRAGFIDTSTTDRVGTIPARFLRAIKLHVMGHYQPDNEKMLKALVEAARNVLGGEVEPAMA